MKNKKLCIFFLLFNLILNVNAETKLSTNNNSTATINASCRINTTNLNFGNYNPLIDNKANSNIKIQCTKGAMYYFKIDDYNMSCSSRVLGALNFNLYINSNYDTPISSPSCAITGGTPTYVGDGTEQNQTIYGKIPANQYVTPGNYSAIANIYVYY